MADTGAAQPAPEAVDAAQDIRSWKIRGVAGPAGWVLLWNETYATFSAHLWVDCVDGAEDPDCEDLEPAIVLGDKDRRFLDLEELQEAMDSCPTKAITVLPND